MSDDDKAEESVKLDEEVPRMTAKEEEEEEDWRVFAVPCVGSGLCCLKTRCFLGTQIHGPGAECPSLVWKNERYWCRELLEAKEEKAKSLREQLSVGAGCCMPLFNHLRDERFNSMTDEQVNEYKNELVSLRRSSEK